MYRTELGFAEERADLRTNLLANTQITQSHDFFPDPWRDEEEVALEDKINFAFRVAQKAQEQRRDIL